YATENGIDCNYEDFCFVAMDDGKIAGAITGRAYYNEVHVGDLIVAKECRGKDVGTKLMLAVEEEYRGKGRENINLSTYEFQARGFYEKLGYEVEFVRPNSIPKLTKYFLRKKL
ncbi:MAG: GNAT family N-acetyltransferase, partial [Clostridiales bacterium]|nr:GNAT family N-acetyltransferase [Clostridiales bacterium]MBR6253816.1 GNAT family N-acetyltransferase [Clostridiales bacterium]